MEARLVLVFLFPAIILIPAIILHIRKGQILRKSMKKYRQYENGEVEDTVIDDALETLDVQGYEHKSYGSDEEAEKAFGNKYVWMIRALYAFALLVFCFSLYAYMDFKINLVTEADAKSSVGIQVGDPIPLTSVPFELKELKESYQLKVMFSNKPKEMFVGEIYMEIFDAVDSSLVFSVSKKLVPDYDDDENLYFPSYDTTVVFERTGSYIMNYYPLTVDIPPSHILLKSDW